MLILQAALRLSDGEIFTRPRPMRHPSLILEAQALGKDVIGHEQGFVFGSTLEPFRIDGFAGRQDAYKIAHLAGQIMFSMAEPNTSGLLYTEDLW